MFDPIVLPEIPTDFPIPLAADDVPYETARQAYYATSFSPDRRGKTEQAEYLRFMIAVGQEMQKLAGPDRLEEVASELTRFKDGYLRRLLSWLNAKSRCMSSMITGPANFPVARNQKRLNTEHRLSVELMDWSKKAQAAMRRNLSPPVVIVPVADQVVALEKQRDLMKALNAEYRKVKGDIDAMILPSEKLRETMKVTRESYWLGKDRYKPFEGFDLTSINGKIKRLQASVVVEARRESAPVREAMVGDIRIVDNPEADRVQAFFDGKPDAVMRDRLKKNGFRWTPSVGCWQAYRSPLTFSRLDIVFMENVVFVTPPAE